MFVQVITAEVGDPDVAYDRMRRWHDEVRPGAIGWLGTTAGITDDNRFVALARFESAAAAKENSDRPEQGAWWTDLAEAFVGDATFADSSVVDFSLPAEPVDAGFVQVMRGRTSDNARARELANLDMPAEDDPRTDVIGQLAVDHGDGAYTAAIYFTSEAAAREGERREPSPEMAARMQEMDSLTVGETEWFDLRQPIVRSADG